MTGSDHGRMTLRAIELFVAVVEEGSLATGGRRLGASPSTVSQQISNLEAALGAKLIERSARPIALTPAGYVFQRYAFAILDEATQARSKLVDLGLTGLPQIRLAMIEDFDADVTPALALRLSKLLPDCNVVCHTGQSHQNLAAIESRGEDIVVAADIEALPDWIEQHPLLREPYILVTAKGLLRDREDAMAQLMAAPMVRYAASQLMCRQIETHLRRLRFAPPRRFEFDSNHAVMAMVVECGGWAIATPLGYLRAARFHEALDLRALPLKGFSRTISLYARCGVLGSLPERAAVLLRELIAAYPVAQAARVAPWLGDGFRLLGKPLPAGEEPQLWAVKG